MLNASKVLANIPVGLRDPLFQSYQDIVTNFAEHRWEPSELNGGKFCEIVYTIIYGAIKGTFAAKPSKPPNMVKACSDLEKLPANPTRIGDRSLRILIPRTLMALYDIRNNRGVGHAGGDVNPNFMDATVVCSIASWVLAELVRIFHHVSTNEAQETVDALVQRKISLVWDLGDIKRVLDPKMKKDHQVLLLLYTKPAWMTEGDLLKSVEYSDATLFRANILRSLHKKRLIEYDEDQQKARISPSGSQYVERQIIKTQTP